MLSMGIVFTLTLLFHTLFEILTMVYSEYLTIVYYYINSLCKYGIIKIKAYMLLGEKT